MRLHPAIFTQGVYMDIWIIILTSLLFIAQFALCYHQLKKGAPDGRVLLIINIISFVIWLPLTILEVMTSVAAIRIAWFVVTIIYMVFTLWYTNRLSKSFRQ